MPSGTFHAMSPVRALTATRLPHGGRLHNQPRSPPMMLPVRGSPSFHWNREVGPTMEFRRYGLRPPSGAFSTQPILASSFVLTKTYPIVGSAAVPPQLAPPIDPGKRIVENGFAPVSRYT